MMKTFIKQAALSAVIIATLFACTKDLKETKFNTQDGNLSLAKEKTAEKVSKKPVLFATQSPAPASVGKDVTVTYTAKDATTFSELGCGKITIYKWDGTQWLEVASANAPSASFTFKPATATDCAYKFRAGFAPGGGNGSVSCSGNYAGVDYTTEPDFCVDVQECVETFTIAPQVDAVDLKNGQYEFTITYTLTSPVDVKGVKFQGGATAGGKIGSTITDLGNTTEVNVNNNNTVLKWDGDLQACTPQKVWFKYRRNFICTNELQAITGEWTAKTGEILHGSIAPLTHSCN